MTRQASKPAEGWGAVIEHQPSYSPAAPVQREPDEYFNQSQQVALYRNGYPSYTDLARRTVERLGYDGALEYFQALRDELGVSAVRELEPEPEPEPETVEDLGPMPRMFTREWSEWSARRQKIWQRQAMERERAKEARRARPAPQARQLPPAPPPVFAGYQPRQLNGYHQSASLPERKPFGQRLKEWLFGPTEEIAALRPIPKGFSPHNCSYCGSNRLQWGKCLDCDAYKLM